MNAGAFWLNCDCGMMFPGYGVPPMILPAALRTTVPGWKTVPMLNWPPVSSTGEPSALKRSALLKSPVSSSGTGKS